MAVRKIADLRAEAEQKYTDLELETASGVVVRLRNLLRLEDAARDKAQTLLKALDEKAGKAKGAKSGAGQSAEAFDALTHQGNVLRDLFLLVCDKPEDLTTEVDGWDLALRMHVLELWMEATQPGEASSSPSS